MTTKYLAEIALARALIVRKGTLCVWTKAVNTNTADDPSPEFPTEDDVVTYPNVPIIFYPEKRLSLFTVLQDLKAGTPMYQLYGMIPGDVGFVPEIGDIVTAVGRTIVVTEVNTTQPDLVPIVHELSFK